MLLKTIRLVRAAQSALGVLHVARVASGDWAKVKAQLADAGCRYVAIQAGKGGPWAILARGKLPVPTDRVHPPELGAALVELLAHDTDASE